MSRQLASHFFRVMTRDGENMNTTLAKSTERLDLIPLRWSATTAPITPFTLPAFVRINVTPNAIEVRPESTAGPPDEEASPVEFPKNQIIGVEMTLMPDSPYSDYLHAPVDNLSRAIVRHQDRFGVVEFFESMFVSDKAYWLKALEKALKERLGVEASVVSGQPSDDIPF